MTSRNPAGNPSDGTRSKSTKSFPSTEVKAEPASSSAESPTNFKGKGRAPPSPESPVDPSNSLVLSDILAAIQTLSARVEKNELEQQRLSRSHSRSRSRRPQGQRTGPTTPGTGSGNPARSRGHSSRNNSQNHHNHRDKSRYPTRSSSPRDRKSVKRTDPPRLNDGKEEGPRFSAWKKLMQGKFHDNSDHFNDEASRMGYVFERTEGEAQRHLDPLYLTGRPDSFQTADHMIEYLASIYENDQERRDAKFEYDRLSQRENEPFQHFKTRFIELANLAMIPDMTRQDDLFDKCCEGLQRQLYGVRHKWTSLQDMFRDIEPADKERQRIETKFGKRSSRRFLNNSTSTVPTTTMSTNRLLSAAETKQSRSPTPGILPVPAFRRSSTTPPDKRLSPNAEVRECFTCGRKDHLSRNCPSRNGLHEIEEDSESLRSESSEEEQTDEPHSQSGNEEA